MRKATKKALVICDQKGRKCIPHLIQWCERREEELLIKCPSIIKRKETKSPGKLTDEGGLEKL